MSDELARLIGKLFTKQMKEQKRKEKGNKYKLPKIVRTWWSHKQISEIWAILKSYAKRADSRMNTIQRYLSKVATAVVRAIDMLSGSETVMANKNDLLTQLIDALSIMGLPTNLYPTKGERCKGLHCQQIYEISATPLMKKGPSTCMGTT